MKFTANYEVTASLQDASVRQFFFSVLLRPRIGAFLAIFAVTLGVIILDPPFKTWVVGFCTALSLLLVVMWVKTYLQVVGQARAGLRLMEHPRVEITMDDSLIEYVSSTGTRRHQWSKIERVEETKDFVILMNGKVPLLSLPKASFSAEALTFLKGRPIQAIQHNAGSRPSSGDSSASKSSSVPAPRG
jgi:hypothetical protein